MKSAAGGKVNFTEHVTRVATLADIEALPLKTETHLVSAIDDDKARALARLRQLRTLYQDGNPRLSDVGLEAIARLDSLRSLDLEWCEAITDDGLESLKRLVGLEWLDLGGCSGLTEVGVRKLQSALPGCTIEQAV